MLPGVIDPSVELDGPLVRDRGVSANNTTTSTSYLPLQQVCSTVHEPVSGATKLRKMLLETNELIVCPGVYDGLSARTAIELGFNAMYMVSCLPNLHLNRH